MPIRPRRECIVLWVQYIPQICYLLYQKCYSYDHRNHMPDACQSSAKHVMGKYEDKKKVSVAVHLGIKLHCDSLWHWSSRYSDIIFDHHYNIKVHERANNNHISTKAWVVYNSLQELDLSGLCRDRVYLCLPFWGALCSPENGPSLQNRSIGQ